MRGLQSSLQTSDQVKDQVDEFGRRENGCVGGAEGEGGTCVSQFFCNVVQFASKQKMLDSFCFLAELVESIGVSMDFF